MLFHSYNALFDVYTLTVDLFPIYFLWDCWSSFIYPLPCPTGYSRPAAVFLSFQFFDTALSDLNKDIGVR